MADADTFGAIMRQFFLWAATACLAALLTMAVLPRAEARTSYIRESKSIDLEALDQLGQRLEEIHADLAAMAAVSEADQADVAHLELIVEKIQERVKTFRGLAQVYNDLALHELEPRDDEVMGMQITNFFLLWQMNCQEDYDHLESEAGHFEASRVPKPYGAIKGELEYLLNLIDSFVWGF